MLIRRGAWLGRIVFPLVILFALLATARLSGAPDYRDLVGRWSGEHRGEELLFEFASDGTCRLTFSDPTTGTSSVVSGQVEVESSKTPMALTIRNIPQLPNPLHTIVDFPTEGVLRMAPPAPGWRLRPIAFSADSLTLTRVPEQGG